MGRSQWCLGVVMLGSLTLMGSCSAPRAGARSVRPGFTVPGQGRVVELSHPLDAGSQCGTRLLAPAASVLGSESADRVSPGRLVGPLVVLDLRESVPGNPDRQVTIEDLQRFEMHHGEIPSGAIVALLSGWSSRWGRGGLYLNPDGEGVAHFPGFSPAAVEFLVSRRFVHGLAVDGPALDPGEPGRPAALEALHQGGRYVVEHLTGLDQVPATGALLVVMPLAPAGSAAAPARVFALAPRSAATGL